MKKESASAAESLNNLQQTLNPLDSANTQFDTRQSSVVLVWGLADKRQRALRGMTLQLPPHSTQSGVEQHSLEHSLVLRGTSLDAKHLFLEYIPLDMQQRPPKGMSQLMFLRVPSVTPFGMTGCLHERSHSQVSIDRPLVKPNMPLVT